MTALSKYQKLEGRGLWAASRPDQRRDVVVAFGDATLVILDGKSGQVLGHWSLPAITRLNPGTVPAIYSPDGDPSETLELDDTLLIDALDTLRAALEPRLSLFQKLRRAALWGAGAVTVALAVFVVPSALVEHTASVVPMAKRTELGEAMLADLAQDGARLCTGGLGSSALAALHRRLFDGPGRLVVVDALPGDAPRVQHFPGRLLVVDKRLLDAAETPDELAGALVVAAARAATEDPLRTLLSRVGTIATFRLLTTGDLAPGALHGQAAGLLQTPLRLPPSDALVAQFQAARLSPQAFLLSTAPMDPSRDLLVPALSTIAAPDGDAAPLISDGQWVSILNLCAA